MAENVLGMKGYWLNLWLEIVGNGLKWMEVAKKNIARIAKLCPNNISLPMHIGC